MLTVTAEQLSKILTKYNGKLIDATKVSPYQQFSLGFYANPQIVSDGRVQFTSQLDITEAYQNYQQIYKTAEGATFVAFVKWIAIKAMLNTPFNWRLINNQWYEFSNLPLEVSVRTRDERQQILYFMNDVSHSSWETFCKKHAALAPGVLKDDLDSIKELPIHAVAQEVVGLRINRMTQYNTTNKISCEHQPWMVFSLPYPQEGRTYLPFHISFSHSTLTPKLAEDFLEKFSAFARMSPREVASQAQALFNQRSQEPEKPSFTVNYLPGYGASVPSVRHGLKKEQLENTDPRRGLLAKL